jgi:hypothetical protein
MGTGTWSASRGRVNVRLLGAGVTPAKRASWLASGKPAAWSVRLRRHSDACVGSSTYVKRLVARYAATLATQDAQRAVVFPAKGRGRVLRLTQRRTVRIATPLTERVHGQICRLNISNHQQCVRVGSWRELRDSDAQDATSEAIRDWVTNVEDTHYILGSAAGATPLPAMVQDFKRDWT